MYDIPDLRIVSQSSRMVTLYGVHWQESPKDAIRRIEKENKVPRSAQSTGTLGHAFVSKMYAQIYSLNPNVERVTMNLGYKRLLGGGNFKYGPRPDVGILYKDGTVRVIEVASKTDIVEDLRLRNSGFMWQNRITGDVKISKLAQIADRLNGRLKGIINKFKPCR